MEPIGIYIHIPFCRCKCPYCDFYSLPYGEELAQNYVEIICQALLRQPYVQRKADTLYFGGGTPSLLSPYLLEKIIHTVGQVFSLDEGAEITLEANPGTLTKDGLRTLRGVGINRLSLGIQSLRDQELRALGRIHTAQQAVEMVDAAYEVGFENLSGDLMLGIPYQTPESLEQTIREMGQLPLTHLSAYLLKVEPGTPFARRDLTDLCADEDGQADLYLQAVEQLAGEGFLQYEISNFARNGCVSRHNSKYWRLVDYLGLGPAAHSAMDGRRFYFPRDLQAFLSADSVWDRRIWDGDAGGLEEMLMLGLRLTQGVTRQQVEHLGGSWETLQKKARPLAGAGLVELWEDRVALTPRGFLVSNPILTELTDICP